MHVCAHFHTHLYACLCTFCAHVYAHVFLHVDVHIDTHVDTHVYAMEVCGPYCVHATAVQSIGMQWHVRYFAGHANSLLAAKQVGNLVFFDSAEKAYNIAVERYAINHPLLVPFIQTLGRYISLLDARDYVDKLILA